MEVMTRPKTQILFIFLFVVYEDISFHTYSIIGFECCDITLVRKCHMIKIAYFVFCLLLEKKTLFTIL